MKIGVIGAGWYGCHLALALKKAGHDVVVYEKNPEIFSQVSGQFGIRLHAGPHYPRSTKTRESCHRGFEEFNAKYPELVIPHEYSIYGLGAKDADGNPSKVTREQFRKVCEESSTCRKVDPKAFGYEGLISAYNIDEPSIALGKRLRSTFEEHLRTASIEVRCNAEIRKLESSGSKAILSTKNTTEEFDKVINATSYQSFTFQDPDFPFDMEVVYQPCLALLYKDKTPGERPFSFIVMDGWFPCMMPYICDEETPKSTPSRQYILTHGKWTIMGSYNSAPAAREVLSQLDDEFIRREIKELSEKEMRRFWPAFAERFEYIGWKGEVIAKLRTKREFRSAVTFEKDNVIHIVPGKVSNIFDAETEVLSLLRRENILERKGYLYVEGGVLHTATCEIIEKPTAGEANTGNLQTLADLQRRKLDRLVFFPPQRATQWPQLPAPPCEFITNYSFQLKCLAAISSSAAFFTLVILANPTVGIPLLATVGTAALFGVSCYYGYKLFTTPHRELATTAPATNTHWLTTAATV